MDNSTENNNTPVTEPKLKVGSVFTNMNGMPVSKCAVDLCNFLFVYITFCDLGEVRGN